VITAGDSTPTGFCATSLATVSLDPALVSFAINVRTVSWGTISTAEPIMAHLLGDGQEDLARRFGRSGAAKFAPPTRWQRDDLGLPLLHGVLAWLVLAPMARLPVEDHVLVVCRVIRAAVGDDAGGPLIHHAGRYTSLAGHPGQGAPVAAGAGTAAAGPSAGSAV
jgi:flavin reductase (DIM6/NTAB) family NADH-FMN oxidoreductase RutF